MKTAEMCFSKTCANFGRCYGNQGWAKVVEKSVFGLQISPFKLSESFKSVAQGVVEIFEEVAQCAHLDRVNLGITITMAPVMVSFNLVFYRLSEKVTFVDLQGGEQGFWFLNRDWQ